jgi:hypothetical protein
MRTGLLKRICAVVLVRKVTADKVLEGLKGEGGTLMKTSLEQRYRQLLTACRRQYLRPLLIAAPDKATFRRACLSFFGCPLTHGELH